MCLHERGQSGVARHIYYSLEAGNYRYLPLSADQLLMHPNSCRSCHTLSLPSNCPLSPTSLAFIKSGHMILANANPFLLIPSSRPGSACSTATEATQIVNARDETTKEETTSSATQPCNKNEEEVDEATTQPEAGAGTCPLLCPNLRSLTFCVVCFLFSPCYQRIRVFM